MSHLTTIGHACLGCAECLSDPLTRTETQTLYLLSPFTFLGA